MIKVTSVASTEAVGYPRMIQGKASTGFCSVIAYQMNEQQAIVLQSNSHDVPPGRLLCDKGILKDYFCAFHGTMTLES